MDYVALVSRWLHVGSVILLVGGSAFWLLVLAPALDRLGDAVGGELRAGLNAYWRKLVHPLVALILLSGLYNFYARMTVHPEPPWHMLAGIKLLLGVFILFVASALVGRSEGLKKMRDNWRFWLKVNLIAAAVAVMLSGYLRFLQPAAPPAEKAPVTQPA